MVVALSSHAASTGLNYNHIMTRSVLLSSIAEDMCTKLKKIQSCITSDERTHSRWCEQLIKHKFPLYAPANLETSCLHEICEISRKLHFPVSLVCPRPRNSEVLSSLQSSMMYLHMGDTCCETFRCATEFETVPLKERWICLSQFCHLFVNIRPI
jgi:hypothetical protein